MKARSLNARADRASLAGMGLGLALMCLTSAPWAFRAGFFLVLGSTVAQIVFSHLAAPEDGR
jgi:hypothetical protein